jgi:uncharacterized protein (TIGR02231 family)
MAHASAKPFHASNHPLLRDAVAQVHTSATLSAISNVTLYPDGATIERQIELPAQGSRIEIACLPVSFDPQSLRLNATANVQLGDFHIEDAANGDGPSNARCATTDRARRIQALQAQLADLDARAQAIELSAQYLQNVSQQDTSSNPSGATVRALEQNGFAVYAQRDQIKKQQDDIRKRLDVLRGDNDSDDDKPVATRTLRVAYHALHGGRLTFSYDTGNAGWRPAYQASLDSATGRVTLERRALVAQATGEDWRGVALQLSTGTPTGSPAMSLPDTWRLQLAPSYNGIRGNEDMAAAPMAAPAPVALSKMSDRENAGTPLFEPTQIEGTFLTKFEIPGRIDVPSDAQKVGFTLARQSFPVKLTARALPEQSPHAWLVATATRPDGVWPDGNVQLRRDNAQAGEIRLSQAYQDNSLALPFGPDEQVTVTSADGADASGTVKTLGGNASKTISRRYTVKNLHHLPIDVEIVASTPISDSADVKVTSTFAPQPDDTDWQGHQGLIAWKRTLAAGEEASVSASYTIRYPGKQTIIGLP